MPYHNTGLVSPRRVAVMSRCCLYFRGDACATETSMLLHGQQGTQHGSTSALLLVQGDSSCVSFVCCALLLFVWRRVTALVCPLCAAHCFSSSAHSDILSGYKCEAITSTPEVMLVPNISNVGKGNQTSVGSSALCQISCCISSSAAGACDVPEHVEAHLQV